jgi:osmoprotectant transport system substrate-binding protein/osmoprotectant transport system permease protein
MGLIEFLLRNRAEFLQVTLEHLFLVAVSTFAAAALGIPLGVLLTRRPALSKPVLAGANVLQTIPSLALFGFLIPLLGSYGIGRVPAIIALFLYSLLPIIRNTFTGINGVDPAVREAARGMGMTDWQVLTQVEMPLALGVIIAGVRVATVIAVGTATIAAAIGAGGLGMYIFRGLRMNDNTLILAGAIPAAIMALGADFVLGWVERSLAPGRASIRSRAAKWAAAAAALALIAAGLVYATSGALSSRSNRVVVGSKDFTEQVILSELLAQAIETHAGLDVERKFELAGDLCHRGMLAGEIDGYVEYTGTAFTAILKHEPITDPREVYETVKRDYQSRFNQVWLDPLGFNNTFAILVRGDDARRLGLKTISDAAAYAPRWRAGFGQDFIARKDGYQGLAQAYGLRFAQPPRDMDLALTYRALAAGQVDLIAGNSTDGLIDKLGLYQLEDDRRYFPPYEAAPVFRKEIIERHPQIAAAVKSLAGRLTDAEMRRLNYAIDGEHRDVKEVVREFLQAQPANEK